MPVPRVATSIHPNPRRRVILRAMKQLLALSLLVGCATAVAHWPALNSRALTFDDNEYLTENRLVNQPGWESLRRFWTEIAKPSTVPGYYQPLTMTSLMVDSALGGSPNNLTPYHATSLGLHVINAILVFIVICQLFRAAIPAAIAAMLFGIHPVAVESICWVGERKTLLATGLALASLAVYLSHAHRGKGWIRLAASIALFALAMLAKPSVMALPLVMLVLDAWPLRRLGAQALVEKTPYALIAVTGAVVAFVSQQNTYGVTLPTEAETNPLLTVCHNTAFYLFKALWPMSMSAYYPIPSPFDFSNAMVLTGAILIPVIALVAGLTRPTVPVISAGVAVFAMALLPAIGIVGFHPVIAADRHLYFPILGLLLPLTALFDWLLQRRSLLLPIVAGVAFILATRQTRMTITHWRDTVSLFTYFTQLAPVAPAPLARLGSALLSAGHAEQAIAPLSRSVELRPTQPNTLRRLAQAQLMTGRAPEAVVSMKKAVEMRPNSLGMRRNLAWALVAAGELDAAVEHFQIALKMAPKDSAIRRELQALREQLNAVPTTQPVSPSSQPTTLPSPG